MMKIELIGNTYMCIAIEIKTIEICALQRSDKSIVADSFCLYSFDVLFFTQLNHFCVTLPSNVLSLTKIHFGILPYQNDAKKYDANG